MSFNSNDINNTIHLGNYEEFFILYLDNELSDEQLKMVDEFLIKYPHLQSELDILYTTKLPSEVISFNKESLFADHMKLNTVEEDLLLYIDNELPKDKELALKEKIDSDRSIQLQYQALLYTKLAAADTIAYPNKEELYHRTEKVVAFRIWMRVAAIILLIAVLGLTYWMSSSSTRGSQPVAVRHNTSTEPIQTPVASPANTGQSNEQTAVTQEPKEQEHSSHVAVHNENSDQKQKNTIETQPSSVSNNNGNNQVAVVNNESMNPPTPRPTSTINTKLIASVDVNTDLINNPSVTYIAPERTTTIDNQTTAVDSPTQEPSDTRKGSLKGLLRRATRVIEKRTGIDPTNGGDELLIGAVAVKLK